MSVLRERATIRAAAPGFLLAAPGLLLAVTLVGSGPPAQAGDFSPGARRVAEELGFGDDQLAKLLAGEIVSHRFHKEDKKELAVTVAALSPQSVGVVFDQLKSQGFLHVDRTILASGEIDSVSPVADDFRELVLPAAEIEKLVNVEPGTDFNLSSEEIASLSDVSIRLREAPAHERADAVMQRFRELLADRVRAYQTQGVAGVAGYARKRGTADPAQDLASAVPLKTGLLAREAPGFYRALADYPRGSGPRGSGPKGPGGAADVEAASSEVDSRFMWFLQEINERPAVVLAHRIVGRDGGNAFLAQRDFYVAHTFDALQVIVGCFGMTEGSVLFYVNRTYTEQVAGFGSSAAHAIGRKIMTGEVVTLFEAVLAEMGKRSGS